MPPVDSAPAASTLSRLRLVVAAIEKGAVVVDRHFPPGATVTVGSNSRNGLVLPPRFELTSYTLVTQGSLLHLAPPLHVQTTVWDGEEPLELRGFWRELRRKHPHLPDALPLASERFVVSYATGVAFMGRFVVEETAAT